MSSEKKIVGLVGSPNKDGRTFDLVSAALDGCRQEGAETELIQMSDYVVDACKDCLPWICKEELKCTFKDEGFEYLTEALLNCGGLVMGTPVYWWDTSAMVKFLILKMFRVFAMSSPLNGLPALGVSIAGGTGNGVVSGIKPIYHFFQMMQMRPLEPVPAIRFNMEACMERSGELGRELARMSKNHTPFSNRATALALYDKLPYLGLNRLEERRLLTDLIVLALPVASREGAAGGLAKADILAAEDRMLDSASEVAEVYARGFKKLTESDG